MRKKIIAGNWKMHLTHLEAVDLVRELKGSLENDGYYEVVLCPPFTALYVVAQELPGSFLKLGAQNVFYVDEGAYTGEISPKMLKALGCEYVIVGHSERRKYFREDDDLIAKKVKAVVENGMTPILCVGETLEEREEGKAREIISYQLEKGLAQLSKDSVEKVVIAYEPVWAIGTGKNATPQEAQEMHAFIRSRLRELFGGIDIPVIYGGSVKPENIYDLTSMPDVDGALVGGASIKASSFSEIIKKAYRGGH